MLAGPSKNNLSPEIARVVNTKGSQSDQEDIQLTDLSVPLESLGMVSKLADSK